MKCPCVSRTPAQGAVVLGAGQEKKRDVDEPTAVGAPTVADVHGAVPWDALSAKTASVLDKVSALETLVRQLKTTYIEGMGKKKIVYQATRSRTGRAYHEGLSVIADLHTINLQPNAAFQSKHRASRSRDNVLKIVKHIFQKFETYQ